MIVTFHVVINTDEESILKRASTGRPITCPVHVQFDGTPFPAGNWIDFAVVILGWWTEQVLALKEGSTATAKLDFMDGPYQIIIRPANPGLWRVDCIVRELQRKKVLSVEIQSQQIVDEVIRVSQGLLVYLKGLAVWDADCEKLESLVEDCFPKDG
jgi:hypothetical protein